MMNSEDLKMRFKKFAIDVALLIKELPNNGINTPYSNQLIRSASSPGANYRAACRAKSTADFINKLKIVGEELDESIYFLELLHYFNSKFEDLFKSLEEEGNELLAIIVKSLKTIKDKNPKS